MGKIRNAVLISKFDPQQNLWALNRYLPDSIVRPPRAIGVYEYVYEYGVAIPDPLFFCPTTNIRTRTRTRTHKSPPYFLSVLLIIIPDGFHQVRNGKRIGNDLDR